MAIIHQGDLDDRPWGAFLWRLATKVFSGELIVNIAGKDVHVAMNQGLIVGAESPFTADSALRLAAQSQVITATQVTSLAGKLTGNRAEADAVGRLAGLSPQDTARLRRRAMAQAAARTFQMEQGALRVDDRIEIDSSESLALDVRTIIMVGARQHFTLERVQSELARFGEAFVLPAASSADDRAPFALSQIEQIAVETLVQESTFEQACRRSPQTDPLVIGCIMYSLLCGGLLQVTRGAPVASQRARTVSLGSGSSSGASGARPMPTAPNPYSGVHAMPRAPTHTTGQSGVHRMPTPSGTTNPPGTSTHQSGVHRVPTPTHQSGVHRMPVRTTTPVANRRPGTMTNEPATPAAIKAAEALIQEKLAILDRDGSHYELLGVANDEKDSAIGKAYFALARQLHPDKIASLGIRDDARNAERLFAQINIAFGVLSDRTKRAAYNDVLKAGGTQAVSKQEAELQRATASMIAAEEAYRKGLIALRNEDFPRAADEFDRAISLNDKEGEYWAYKAWTTWVSTPNRASAMFLAKPQFDTAARLAPNGASVPFLLGRIARIEGRMNDAERHFQTAIARQPNHQEALIEIRAIRSRRR